MDVPRRGVQNGVAVSSLPHSRQRIVPIHPALEPLFVDWLLVRARDPQPALFVGVLGKRLSQTTLTQTFPTHLDSKH